MMVLVCEAAPMKHFDYLKNNIIWKQNGHNDYLESNIVNSCHKIAKISKCPVSDD